MIITDENYYSEKANQEYMSVSQLKSWIDCPAKAKASLDGEYKMPSKTPLLVGGYVDAWAEGTLDKYKKLHPEIFKKDGSLKADYVKADSIIERIKSDDVFCHYVLDGEKQVIETAEFFGCKWKIKMDNLRDDCIVDLKCMKDMQRVYGRSFIEYYHYDWQLAVYQYVHYLNTGKKLPCYLAVVTKEEPSNIEIINVPQWRLDECLNEIQVEMPRVLEMKNGQAEIKGCGICDYCRGIKKCGEPIDFQLVGMTNYEIEMAKAQGLC
ncbi:PD-(D/E)XK nuclease-like domain-containing protein [uncultured Eubacterium sp.]|uniref:PD-(D/E)XK nuclease-like domain-containing protein n=1 Tax=uncultured Eubacterium sp. TaxID=165185 RepID=UPI00262D15D3|nr:PD-(D/E)XK nuclease-like domain-containing protein [uncultured Eubacterium sp.]